jgi:hypothetical protein
MQPVRNGLFYFWTFFNDRPSSFSPRTQTYATEIKEWTIIYDPNEKSITVMKSMTF